MWAERRVCDIFDSTLFPECSDRHRKYHSGAALPGEAIPLQQPANAYAAKGMYREALAEYEKYAAFIPGNPLALAYVGYAHARLGERNRALRGLEQLRAASTQRYVPAVSYALVYVGLGEKEQAFTWLEKACEERTNFLAYLKVHAIWDPLRSDPRFKDLLRRVGLSQ
jgi:tetratricopeptide (TPR) repeat protein